MKKNVIDISSGIKIITESGKLPETVNDDLIRFFTRQNIKLDGNFPIRFRIGNESWNENYTLDINDNECLITADSPDGARRAAFRLEEMLLSSETPVLQIGKFSASHWMKNRISRCYYGPIKRPPLFNDELMNDIDYYPDNYLNQLAHEGVNGIWLTIEWREICETSFLPPHQHMERRIAKLRHTVEKCAAYGIKVWVFNIEPTCFNDPDDPLLKAYPEFEGEPYYHKTAFCPSSKNAQRYLYESVNSIFSKVPDLGGMINISHGERGTTCFSTINCLEDDTKLQHCPRCGKLPTYQTLNNALEPMIAGMRDAAPKAQLICWFYQSYPVATRGQWVYEYADHVPDGVILQYNFESGGVKTQLGKTRVGGDYWLSYIGPTPIFEKMAKRVIGADSEIGAKLQVSHSFELSTTPYVPVPGLLYRKYKEMHRLGVSHAMQCWYLGAAPGLMNRAAGMLSFCDFNETEQDFLRELAQSQWGQDYQTVVEAWEHFTVGYQFFPLCNKVQYYGPQHNGATWPLHLKFCLEPLSPIWKDDFPVSGDAMGEMLRNHTLTEILTLFKQICKHWSRGTALLKPLMTKFANDSERLSDLRIAEVVGLQFECAKNIVEFYCLRRQLLLAPEHSAKLLLEMETLVKSEIEVRRKIQKFAAIDKRLGFQAEAECRKYDPKTIGNAIDSLQKLLQHDFPEAQFALKKNSSELQRYLQADVAIYKYDSGWKNSATYKWRIDKENNVYKFTAKIFKASINPSIGVCLIDEAGSYAPRLIVVSYQKKILDYIGIDEWNWEDSVVTIKFPMEVFQFPDKLKARVCIWRVENAIDDHSLCEYCPPAPPNSAQPRLRLNLNYFNPSISTLLVN